MISAQTFQCYSSTERRNWRNIVLNVKLFFIKNIYTKKVAGRRNCSSTLDSQSTQIFSFTKNKGSANLKNRKRNFRETIELQLNPLGQENFGDPGSHQHIHVKNTRKNERMDSNSPFHCRPSFTFTVFDLGLKLTNQQLIHIPFRPAGSSLIYLAGWGMGPKR